MRAPTHSGGVQRAPYRALSCAQAVRRRRQPISASHRANARHRPRASSIHPIHPITIILLRSLPARRSPRFRFPNSIKSAPTRPSFLPSFPSFLQVPRPDRPAGRRAGVPCQTRTHPIHTKQPANRAVRRASRLRAIWLPRRGSKLRAYVRFMDRARNRCGAAAMCARAPALPRDIHETETAQAEARIRSRPTRASCARNSCGAQADARMRNKARAHGGPARVGGAWGLAQAPPSERGVHKRQETARGFPTGLPVHMASARQQVCVRAAQEPGASHHITSHRITS